MEFVKVSLGRGAPGKGANAPSGGRPVAEADRGRPDVATMRPIISSVFCFFRALTLCVTRSSSSFA